MFTLHNVRLYLGSNVVSIHIDFAFTLPPLSTSTVGYDISGASPLTRMLYTTRKKSAVTTKTNWRCEPYPTWTYPTVSNTHIGVCGVGVDRFYMWRSPPRGSNYFNQIVSIHIVNVGLNPLICVHTTQGSGLDLRLTHVPTSKGPDVITPLVCPQCLHTPIHNTNPHVYFSHKFPT